MLDSAQQAAIIAIAFFLLAFFGLAALKASHRPPPIGHGQPVIGEAQGSVESQNGSDNNAAPPKAADAAHNQVPSAKMDAGANHRKEDKEENDAALARYTYWLMAFTFVLAISTVFLTVATMGLWNYAAEQAGDMKESIAVNRVAANAAKEAADAAKKAAEISEQALRMAERPILTISQWHWDNIGPGQSPTFKFEILNTGRTQADIFDHKSYTGYAESIPDEPLYEPGPIHAALAGGGGRQMIYLDEPQTVIAPGRYALMVAGKQFIFIYGRFSYRDAFEDIYDYGFVIKIFADKKPDGSVIWTGSLPDNAGRYIYLKKRKQT